MTNDQQQPYGGQPAQQSPYGQPQPQYGGYGQAEPKWNVLAIVGFILAFLVSIAGLVISIIAFVQIKKTGDKGRGLALAGIIIGAVFLVIGIISSIATFSMMANYSGTGY
jgi:uncharacterized membrane protein